MPTIPTKYRSKVEPTEETQWVQRQITLIPMVNGNWITTIKKTIQAYVYGGLAVHLYCFEYEKNIGKYAISHIKSSGQVAMFKTEEDAMLAAEELWNKYEKTFRWTTFDEVKKEAPKSLYNWCRAMEKAGKYLKETVA